MMRSWFPCSVCCACGMEAAALGDGEWLHTVAAAGGRHCAYGCHWGTKRCVSLKASVLEGNGSWSSASNLRTPSMIECFKAEWFVMEFQSVVCGLAWLEMAETRVGVCSTDGELKHTSEMYGRSCVLSVPRAQPSVPFCRTGGFAALYCSVRPHGAVGPLLTAAGCGSVLFSAIRWCISVQVSPQTQRAAQRRGLTTPGWSFPSDNLLRNKWKCFVLCIFGY